MRKIKIISIMVVALFIGVSVATIGEAFVINEGISADIRGFDGSVHPTINLENETDVTFLVNISTDENDTYYRVEDQLQITINTTDNSGREFLVFPRGIAYAVVFKRPLINVIGEGLMKKNAYPGADSLIKRWFPVFDINAVSVVDAWLGNASNMINISLDYSISEDQYNNSENITMYVYTMGIIPGYINGGEEYKIVASKEVTLHVNYAEITIF